MIHPGAAVVTTLAPRVSTRPRVGGHRRPQNKEVKNGAGLNGRRGDSHTSRCVTAARGSLTVCPPIAAPGHRFGVRGGASLVLNIDRLVKHFQDRVGVGNFLKD